MDHYPTQPANFNSVGNFNSAACNNKLCIAAGAYEDSADIVFPLLAHTTDNGATWVFLIDNSTNFPSDYYYGRFNGVTDSKMSYLPIH